MTGLLLETERLPEDQAENVTRLVNFIGHQVGALTHTERAIYTTLWMTIARASAPVVVANLNYRADTLRDTLDKLMHHRLIWFDEDLRAVLQCPPFSALHSAHEVKAFGWDRAYVCSLPDAALSLLVYGPNTWLNVDSTCPRSGEVLRFRVMLDAYHSLKLEAPADSKQWCVWLPESPDGHLSVGTNGLRSKINAFNTRADFETYQQYNPLPGSGTLYTLEQAVYLSECLLRAFEHALSSDR